MTDDGTYTINTGIKEPSQTQMIEYWNGRSTLDRWINQSAGSSSKCNKIVGTDGSGYPPFREGVERMTIFSSDICRFVQKKAFSETHTYFDYFKSGRWTSSMLDHRATREFLLCGTKQTAIS